VPGKQKNAPSEPLAMGWGSSGFRARQWQWPFLFYLGWPLKVRWRCVPSRMRVVPRPGQGQ